MELDKENVVKTAFNIYCNIIYKREYPFTINNLRMFFEELNDDYREYIGINSKFLYFQFTDEALNFIIKSDNIMAGTTHKDYLIHFINKHQLPI